MIDESLLSLLASLQGETVALLGSETEAPTGPSRPAAYGVVFLAQSHFNTGLGRTSFNGRSLVVTTTEELTGDMVENITFHSRRRGSPDRTMRGFDWMNGDTRNFVPRVLIQGMDRLFTLPIAERANIEDSMRNTPVLSGALWLDGFEIMDGQRHNVVEFSDQLTLADFFVGLSRFDDYTRPGGFPLPEGTFTIKLTAMTYPLSSLIVDLHNMRSNINLTTMRMLNSDVGWTRGDTLHWLSGHLYDRETGRYYDPSAARRNRTNAQRFPTVRIPLEAMDAPRLDYNDFTRWLFNRVNNEDLSQEEVVETIEETPLQRESRISLDTLAAASLTQRYSDAVTRAINSAGSNTVPRFVEPSPEWDIDYDTEPDDDGPY